MEIFKIIRATELGSLMAQEWKARGMEQKIKNKILPKGAWQI